MLYSIPKRAFLQFVIPPPSLVMGLPSYIKAQIRSMQTFKVQIIASTWPAGDLDLRLC